MKIKNLLMKKILLFSVLLYVATYSQKINKNQVYDKYLKNGAYQGSYYNPKYQKYLDSALVLLPKDPYLWQQKSMPYFKKKQYELGFLALDNAVKYDDEYYTYHSYHAFIKCIFEKNYTDAVNEFDALIKFYPKGIIMDHSYYFYKSLSLIQLNRLNEAEENLNISLNLFKGNIEPHFLELFYMGIICYEKEDYEKGIQFFDKSLKQYPKFSDALYYKAKCLYNINQPDKAFEILKKSKEFLSEKYTINEDNAFYEDYPYQIKSWMVDNLIQQMGVVIKQR
ncbi:tetratricopeptide repeat protein [Kaistella flava (ex Peng et al. 2021)]|uniref:Tetratricopeptide repeat protein n=2 Tax=Kaistella flava (ex Peng et al. 2021) TaxID=2038776 RepID=A0A7M2Y6X2_9FLAO|nr:tetratricopeptide repeat protein [Kaistella flava (ex Peng et al. 2021)]